MNIKDFYGSTVRELLKRGIRPNEARFDDLVQEGVIAAWQAIEGKELRDPGTYGRVAAKRRIGRLLSRPTQPFGGSTGSKTYDLHAQWRARADMTEAEETPFAPTELDGDLRDIILSLPEIEQAIAVGIARGNTVEEIAEDLDMYSWTVADIWENHLRSTLASLLAV